MKNEASIKPSDGLKNVRYEIRGALARRAIELERQGYEIISLNIGNPGAYGFRTPEILRLALVQNLPQAEGYSYQKGIYPAREAILLQQQNRGVRGGTTETIFIGNGTSELIDMSLRALLSDGDEVLVPAPDYPLWTAAVTLNGGKPVHYPLPAGEPLPSRSGRNRSTDHAAHARAGGHQSEQPHGCRVSARGARAPGAPGRKAPADGVLSDEIYDGITYENTPVRADRIAGERHAVRNAVRPVEGLSCRRLSRGLGQFLGRHAACHGIPGRHGAAHVHAHVQQRAGAVRRAQRAGRLPEHHGSHQPGRPVV